MIIYTGHLDKELKGIPILIEAFRVLQAKTPEIELDLVLIGKGQNALRTEYHSIPGVHILGPRYGIDFVRLLASADIFLAASRWETFWLAPLEAMACGLPIVVSTAGAVPSMIPENGIQGCSIPIVDAEYRYLPDAAERLADAAFPLILNKELRLKIGQTAREHACNNFSEKRLGENLVNAFVRALQENQAG